jgi:hypothetical protein
VICAWTVVKKVTVISSANVAATLSPTELVFDLNLDSPVFDSVHCD